MTEHKPWVLVEQLNPSYLRGKVAIYRPTYEYTFHQADFMATDRASLRPGAVDLIGVYDDFLLVLVWSEDGITAHCPMCVYREPEAERLARCD